MNRYVLDSYAIFAFLQQESGWQKVDNLIATATTGDIELYMSAINMAEVKYMLARRGPGLQHVVATITALPIHFVSADESIDKVVELKSRYALSLADCFCAAVAIELGCPLVTGDPEFKKLEEIARIEWLR